MIIRPAVKEDLPRIMELGKQFGHQMLYQKDPELMERYLPRIIVAEEDSALHKDYHRVVGFYHYIVDTDPGFIEMLQCYRQIPDQMADEIFSAGPTGTVCVVMQGGCHRDTFKGLILYLQARYSYLFSWNSVTDKTKPSSKIEGYKELGFTFDPKDEHKFFNVHKGDYSTYTLGRWEKR